MYSSPAGGRVDAELPTSQTVDEPQAKPLLESWRGDLSESSKRVRETLRIVVPPFVALLGLEAHVVRKQHEGPALVSRGKPPPVGARRL